MMHDVPQFRRAGRGIPWWCRRLIITLILVPAFPLALEAGPAPSHVPMRVDIGAAATTYDGVQVSLSLLSTSLNLRVFTDGSMLRMGLRTPSLQVGSVRPSGLAAFLYRPAGAGLLLLDQDGPVLAMDNPRYARYEGIMLGQDYGLFGLVPESRPDRPAYGAWIAPRDAPASLLVTGSVEPADQGGPGWYDPPSPAADRLWLAGGLGGSGPRWAWALAGASTSGYPGPDAAAARAEARLSVGHLRLTVAAAATGGAWRAPDGVGAAAARIDAEARYASRGLAATLGWCLAQEDDTAPVLAAYHGSLELVGSMGRFYAAGTMEATPTGSMPDLTVSSSWRTGFAPWTRLATSWAAADGQSRRLDLLADARVGTSAGVLVSGGLRFLPEGACVKASGTIFMQFGSVVVELEAETPDWMADGSPLPDALVYSARVRTRLDFTSPGK